MALPSVYTQAYGQIPAFFKKLQEGQAPSKFTQQHLKDIGFASTNHRAFIPLLKVLGFLSSDGVPTERYQAYRDSTQSRQVLGEAIKEAYADLFVIKSNPTKKDKKQIAGKFKSAHNTSDITAERMANTFLALLDIADIKHETKKIEEQPEKGAEKEPGIQDKIEKSNEALVVGSTPGLHYNIQIHLPATKDVEVYNAIF